MVSPEFEEHMRWGDTPDMTDWNWNIRGISGLGTEWQVMKNLGDFTNYTRSLFRVNRDINGQDDNYVQVTARLKENPIIMEVDLAEGGTHAVTVHWVKDAQVQKDGKWVSAPYQIIDGWWSDISTPWNSSYYLTEDEFRRLWSNWATGSVIHSKPPSSE